MSGNNLKMVGIIVLFVSLLIGVGLQRVKSIPENAHATLGQLILYIPLPAVCLLTLPDLTWTLDLLSLGLVGWIIFFVAFFLFSLLAKKFRWPQELVACLILTAGFCNSAFIGFPVISVLYGEEALKGAIFLDQAGTFLITSTFGVWIAVTAAHGTLRKSDLFRRVIQFPPFIAFVAGVGLGFLGLRPEGIFREVLERLALLLTPMALVSVGLQLKWSELRAEGKYLCLGLGYKLLFAPLLIYTLYRMIGVDDLTFKVAVTEAAMAPMITSSILASSHGLRPKLAGMMVGVGVPLSALTLSLWHFLLH